MPEGPPAAPAFPFPPTTPRASQRTLSLPSPPRRCAPASQGRGVAVCRCRPSRRRPPGEPAPTPLPCMSSAAGSAARSMVTTRRSARRGGNGPLPADGAPSEPDPVAPPPSSAPSRRSRDAAPPRRPDRAREKGSLVIFNDYTLKQPVEAEKQERQGNDIVVVEEPDDMDEDSTLLEPPGWLPDGWITEVYRDDKGCIYQYYISPVSGYTFTSKRETLDYLFSEMEEHMLESQERTEDSKLHGSHTWLPGGWLIEIRVGGKKMDKMYKFYFHPPTGTRLLSKAEVLRYVNERKISARDMDVLCDTSTDDNILAHVEFNPDDLPDGWVKETIFRKCNDGIRKDPYYTDPISRRVFRTLKSVLSYLGTGEISRHAYMPRRNVIDMYSFDKCADLPQSMLKRLKAEGKTKQKMMRALEKELPNDQISKHSEGRTSAGLTPKSDPKGNQSGTEKATGTNGIGSESTKRRRGRPKKILKQTTERISDCDKRREETKHYEANEEVDIGVEEDVPNGKTKEHTEMPKRTTVIQEVENNSNIAERNLSKRKGDESDLMDGPDLHNQESGRLTEAGERATCSLVHKFYKRRCSNQTLGSHKG